MSELLSMESEKEKSQPRETTWKVTFSILSKAQGEKKEEEGGFQVETIVFSFLFFLKQEGGGFGNHRI